MDFCCQVVGRPRRQRRATEIAPVGDGVTMSTRMVGLQDQNEEDVVSLLKGSTQAEKGISDSPWQ